MEFLDAYSENLKNQSRDAINFNALAEILCSICQDELATKYTIEFTLPQLLAKVRVTANEMGIDIDGYGTKFAWAKTPQSLSEELMNLSSLIEDSYGYKIERYKDTIGKNGRKKNNSVIRITDLSIEPSTPKSDGSRDMNRQQEYEHQAVKSLGLVRGYKLCPEFSGYTILTILTILTNVRR